MMISNHDYLQFLLKLKPIVKECSSPTEEGDNIITLPGCSSMTENNRYSYNQDVAISESTRKKLVRVLASLKTMDEVPIGSAGIIPITSIFTGSPSPAKQIDELKTADRLCHLCLLNKIGSAKRIPVKGGKGYVPYLWIGCSVESELKRAREALQLEQARKASPSKMRPAPSVPDER